MKIILAASLSTPPYAAGGVWHRLQYILGFLYLGHDVYYVENIFPNSCVDVHGNSSNFENSVNRSVFKLTMEQFGLLDRACLIYNGGESTLGLEFKTLCEISKKTDLLINWSGHLVTEPILSNIKRRVYLDTDPVYTQLWHSEYNCDLNFKAHDVFFSVGLNIGTEYTAIPDCGVQWHHVLSPVVLDHCPVEFNRDCKRFTTVASIFNFGDLNYKGEWYRSKSTQFERYIELPSIAQQEFEIVLRVDSKSVKDPISLISRFTSKGWRVVRASELSDLISYQNYILSSRAEIGIAQHAYVKGRSGWFSDRSAHYLASGKPVLAQSTGVEHYLPTGKGFLTFSSVEEAIDGITEINRNYLDHCKAARAFAEDYLDYRKVLPQMLEFCM